LAGDETADQMEVDSEARRERQHDARRRHGEQPLCVRLAVRRSSSAAGLGP
jgi:hypothetical protein